MPAMTHRQCRAARAMLGWSTFDLADFAKVSKTTVNKFEQGGDAYQSTIAKLEKAIVSTGKIRFDGKCVCWIGGDE